MEKIRRREFLRSSGLSLLPVIIPAPLTAAIANSQDNIPPDLPMVNFVSDTLLVNPGEQLAQLQKIQQTKAIEADFYGRSGVVAALEKRCADIMGKESAKFFPSGTMANQLALKVLSGENTKIFVQETSHIFRDEADAAQSVHGKRLMPLAKGAPAFTLEDLQQAVEYQEKEEVFHSGIGAVSIECPVRRCDGKRVPFNEIKRISEWCRQKGYKLHLDGARLHLAAAFGNIPLKEYAALFDTVYISLYKYLGAMSGAILCGDKALTEKMDHLIKIHGGAIYQNWHNAALALDAIDQFEARIRKAADIASALFNRLNKRAELKISALPEGTNIFHMKLQPGIDLAKWANILRTSHNIVIPRRMGEDVVRLFVNESISLRDSSQLYDAFVNSLEQAKKA
ncbi:hypothetical protein KTO58_10335 [Chitinophaga pendula]|uniref:threonine aldolase family protein n=1 Tax=Chitinophaga TaxID=79328 RepID=UPI000BAF5E4D|nr:MULTISPECIES: beta-eliminating lyase-related protein [Chitinophaga]ASZ12814.1 threonine aldolase [Chitinophaga sp. MD30]UCJ09561.1 hypothetical protein KTO58_10335 [Chitinophaga pendula]